jgi:hypothetical protein
MESLTRLVSESLARNGFDRPLDYRRLHWSRWFRCESHRSLLSVPSKPGVFAVAEEILNVGTAATGCPAEQSSALAGTPRAASPSPTACESPRMLAVTKFFEDDDMAFTLDRMLSWQNPMRARLESGRYFIRYVVIEDRAQRHSICSALNQWIASSAEIATGIGTHFASSLDLAPSETRVVQAPAPSASPLSAGAAPEPGSRPLTDIRCPPLFPSGF